MYTSCYIIKSLPCMSRVCVFISVWSGSLYLYVLVIPFLSTKIIKFYIINFFNILNIFFICLFFYLICKYLYSMYIFVLLLYCVKYFAFNLNYCYFLFQHWCLNTFFLYKNVSLLFSFIVFFLHLNLN